MFNMKPQRLFFLILILSLDMLKTLFKGLTGNNEAQKNKIGVKLVRSVSHLGLSGEGSGLRGGGVRGTAGLGAIEAAGIKPGAICFYTTHT